MLEFLKSHIDTILTVGVTAIGFIVTYFMTKKNFRDEIKKEKISIATESIQSLPYEFCELMSKTIKGSIDPKEYEKLLSKVIAYGSNDAIKIAIAMQRNAYQKSGKNPIVFFSLLITQLKYDLTSEIISPESWCLLKINDYDTTKDKTKAQINEIIEELDLNKKFKV